ncbi:hypothetical protein BGX34_005459 [Mortierella sp. NVP85]|nr:hypothetical protein BGX34_005459 [Mortierella sp. NVP85]
MRNHRGEVSFPGGKRDPTDETILDTALREMEEEISISRDQVEVLGEFAPMPNKDCTMRVHPFVGFIKEPIEDIESIVFNPDEVYKVFTVPMDELIDPERRSMVRFRTSKFLYPVWKIDAEDITIWGLTAFILDGVLRRIAKEGPTDAMEIPEGVNVEKYIPPTQSAYPPLSTMPTTTVPEETITVIIKVAGADPVEFDLPLTTKVSKLKKMIRNKTGMPIQWQRVTYRNQVLVNTSTLEDYWVPDSAQSGIICHDADCTGQCLTASYESDQGSDDSKGTKIGSDDGYDGSEEEEDDDCEEDYDDSAEEEDESSVEEDDEGYVEEDYDD